MKLFVALIVSIFLASAQAQFDPHFVSDRNTIVHLFEWKWLDIAHECETFLAPRGFGGVQISPPSESVVQMGQWWERYQPVSYRIHSRSGNESEFAEMTRRCNAVGVRIFADAVINHMAAAVGFGLAGSLSNATFFNYPAVPYSALDFNRPCNIDSYNDKWQVRNCRLTGLPDLNQGVEWVRARIVDYMNRLIELGVAGFRVDACKHMWPEDLAAIFKRLQPLNTAFGFPPQSRAFIYLEVIDLGGEAISKYEYTDIGVVTEFRYSMEIGKAFSGHNSLKWLRNFGPQWGFMPSTSALTFVDNHDNQRNHGGGGQDILTYKNSKPYKMATAFHLAWPYGISNIMSSFAFDNTDQGPPADDKRHIVSPQFNSDGACTNGWICEHRWRQIYNMVQFKNVAGGESVDNWWDNGNNQIAFSRGKRAFIAFNLENGPLNAKLQTSLPAGRYCDIASGSRINGNCTGLVLEVDANGFANIDLPSHAFDGFIAFHIGSKL